MKRLDPPKANDVSILRSLAKNTRLGSYPYLSDRIKDILKNYCKYRKTNGDAKVYGSCIGLSDDLADSLKTHYSSPPLSSGLNFLLDNIRDKGSPRVCPMCGSPKTGTLDHLFPKNGLNLVPACDCNNKRLESLTGAGPNERILHPYFDDVLRRRVVSSEIMPSIKFNYDRPSITLKLVLPVSDPNYATVKFHIEKVLARTNVLDFFDDYWPKLCKLPEDYFNLPKGEINVESFCLAVSESLARRDRHFGTPNNWDSILYSGLEANRDACKFLCRRVNELRSGIITPEAL
jgi:hypothetical protein